jgi:hypothetical protein
MQLLLFTAILSASAIADKEISLQHMEQLSWRMSMLQLVTNREYLDHTPGSSIAITVLIIIMPVMSCSLEPPDPPVGDKTQYSRRISRYSFWASTLMMCYKVHRALLNVRITEYGCPWLCSPTSAPSRRTELPIPLECFNRRLLSRFYIVSTKIERFVHIPISPTPVSTIAFFEQPSLNIGSTIQQKMAHCSVEQEYRLLDNKDNDEFFNVESREIEQSTN